MHSPPNVGTARSPLDFGHGRFGYKRNGQWHVGTRRKFTEVTDGELALELERRGYEILCPGHECADRPHLPCPACERLTR